MHSSQIDRDPTTKYLLHPSLCFLLEEKTLRILQINTYCLGAQIFQSLQSDIAAFEYKRSKTFAAPTTSCNQDSIFESPNLLQRMTRICLLMDKENFRYKCTSLKYNAHVFVEFTYHTSVLRFIRTVTSRRRGIIALAHAVFFLRRSKQLL